MDDGAERNHQVIATTRRWLQLAVIGLNLCPFAAGVASAGRIRYRVSDAQSVVDLRTDLIEELCALAASDPAQIETTLLIHPLALRDFLDFNDFLAEADAIVEELALAGQLQVASFHPDYQFAGTGVNDVENCTNRSPYPTLHLLREASIERAVATLREPSSIYERNIETMRRLGHARWGQLQERFTTDASAGSDPEPS